MSMPRKSNQRAVQLPHDVIFLIFHEAANMPKPFNYLSHLDTGHWVASREGHDEEWRRSAGILARLSRVSKHWHEASVPLLYQEMRLPNDPQIMTAAAALEYRHHNPCPWIGSPHGAFVKTLYISNGRDSHPSMNSASLIAGLHSLVVYTPNLRSYHTSTWFSTNSNKTSNSYYSSRIVPSLVKNGRNLTTLDISDDKFILSDVERLISGLPALETFIIGSLLMWQLETSRTRATSTLLKTLVIIEPEGADVKAFCLYGPIFDAMARWSIPKLQTVLIHDCCNVNHVLGNMESFLSAHQSKIRQIVFKRWATEFSNSDVSLFVSKFSEFANNQSKPNSMRFWKE